MQYIGDPLFKVKTFFAKNYLKFRNSNVFCGVVGTTYKDNVIFILNKTLSQKYPILSSSLAKADSLSELPSIILKINPKIKKIILKVDYKNKGELDYYLNLINFNQIVVTNLLKVGDFSTGFDQVSVDIKQLIDKLPKDGLLILNWDDPLVRKLSEKSQSQVVFYGMDQKNCHVWATNCKISNFRTVFELNYGVESVEVNTKLLGVQQIYPLLAAATVSINEGISLFSIKKVFENLEPIEHMMEVVNGHNDSFVIDDTYNAYPEEVEDSIDTLNKVSARRRILVLGEVKGLGVESEKVHRKIARKIYNDRVDLVLLGTGETKYVAEELLTLGFIPERLESNLQNPQIVSKLLKILSRGDVVLVKGARSTRLDEVVKKIIKVKK